MENIAYLYSMVFFFAALLPLYWGFYMIKLDPKSAMNRVFLLLTIALSIWSFGFAMTNLQVTAQAALFWRRFTALGWTSIISLILHFFLLMVNKENQQKSKLYQYRYLLHLPAIIFIIVYSLSNHLTSLQYDMIQGSYGWANQTVNNYWDYFYYLYYAIYLATSMGMVWKWRKSLNQKIRIRQANLILAAFFFAGLLGSFTDVLIPSYLSDGFPQMAPLFILLPVWAMYYSVRHYNILDMKTVKMKGTILTRQQEKKVFRNLAISLFLTAVFTFIFLFFSTQSTVSGDLMNSLLRAGGILALGLMILLIQKIQKQWLREKLTLVLLVISIPAMMFYSVNSSAVTVWAYSLLIIMGSLLFDKRFLLLSTTIIAIFTQLLVWAFRENSTVYVSDYDFILRIAFLGIAFVLGSYVNKVYLSRVRENREQIDFLELISEITFDFLTFSEENSHEKIQNLLKRTGEFFDIDRIYLFTIDHSRDTMTYSNEWCKEGIPSEVGTIDQTPISTYSWWIDQFKKHRIIKIENVHAMPNGARAEQKQLLRQEVKSSVAVPIMQNNRIYAFIGIDSVKEYKSWAAKEIRLLQILANILKNVLTPMQIDKQTQFMAYNDGLTKLPNRYLFINRVNQAIRSSKDTGNDFAVIFVDLDNFKFINDSLGHNGGDLLLKEVARRLEEATREEDTVARFAGDEFLILVRDVENSAVVKRIADKILNLFSKKFLLLNQEFMIGISVGISHYLEDGKTADELIRNADMAMYHAKKKDGNNYVFCTKAMKEKDLRNQKLSADLAHALEHDEFIIHYQPQVRLKTGEIVGLEALIRWMHPKKGLISPGEFIPLAEENNLIDPIGEWVLETVARQRKEWENMNFPAIKVAVNLSAMQLRSLRIAEKIKRVTSEIGLDPKFIELEVTETMVIEKSHTMLKNLNEIQATGASISIDDFGTEYSSLGRLKVLPVNQLKIDMQFVQAIEESEKDRAIITTIIALGKSLGLTMIAEGVETAEQLAFLKEEDCDLVQGFYYYKPMPKEEIEKIIKEKQA